MKDPNQIQNMDDLREAMKDPAVKQAEAEMSKKFLKNNRPKSLMLVVVAVLTVFLLIGLSGHKASSVIPSAMRTCDAVTVTLSDGNTQILSAGQRDQVLAALNAVKVKRDSTQGNASGEVRTIIFSGADQEGKTWEFSVSDSGILCTEKNSYICTSEDDSFLLEQLEALLHAA